MPTFPLGQLVTDEVSGERWLRVEPRELDLRGLIAARPNADDVLAGTSYWAVDRLGEVDEISVSDGTDWINL